MHQSVGQPALVFLRRSPTLAHQHPVNIPAGEHPEDVPGRHVIKFWSHLSAVAQENDHIFLFLVAQAFALSLQILPARVQRQPHLAADLKRHSARRGSAWRCWRRTANEFRDRWHSVPAARRLQRWLQRWFDPRSSVRIPVVDLKMAYTLWADTFAPLRDRSIVIPA